MRKTVLIVTCEAAPSQNRPTSGGTLRIWGLAEGLKSKGYKVLLSIPKEKLFKDDPDEIKKLAHEYKDIGLKVAESGCNVVIVEQWGTATYLDDCGLPYVIDLHGSLALENLYRPGTDITSDAYTKIETLAKADMLVCPNARQKDYFTAWFIMAGRDVKRHPIDVVPIGMPPKLPRKNRSKELRIVYGGTVWPWIDPFPGLELLASKLDKAKKGTLELYIAPPKDESLQNRFDELKKRLKGYRSVKWFEHVSRSELIKRYCSAALAFDLYGFNLERYLASTTRTYEYLWCGLPVLYPDYGELAGEIEAAGSGFVVDPSDEKSIEETIDRILKNPSQLWSMGKNAQKLISDKFTWAKTVKPLVRFIDKPVHDAASKNVVAAFKETYSQLWSKEVKELEKRIKDYELRFMRELEQKEAELTSRQRTITQLEEGTARLQEEVHRRNVRIEELSNQKEELERGWQKKLDDAWANFRNELQQHQARSQSEIARHQKFVEERDDAIASLKREIAQKNRELNSRLKEKDKAIQQRDAKLEALNQKWEQRFHEQELEKREIIKQRDEQIKELNKGWSQKLQALETEKQNLIKEKELIQKELNAKLETLGQKWEQNFQQQEQEKKAAIKERDEQIKELNKDWSQKLQALETEKQSLIKEKERIQKELNAKLETLGQKWEQNFQQQELEKKAAIKERDEQIKELNKDWSQKLQALEAEKQNLIKEKELIQKELNAKLEALGQKWEQRLHEQELEKREIIKQRDEQIKELNAKLEALNQKWEQRFHEQELEKREITKEHDRQIKELQKSYGQRLDAAEKEKQKIIEDRERIQMELNARIEALNQKWQERLEQAFEERNQLVRERDQRIDQLRGKIENTAIDRETIQQEANAKIEEFKRKWSEKIERLEAEKAELLRANEKLSYEFPLKLAELSVNWETKLAHREQDIRKLEGRIEESTNRVKELNRAWEERLAQIKGGFEEQIGQIQGEKANLQSEVERLMTEREELTKRFEREIAKREAEFKELERDIENLIQQIKRAKDMAQPYPPATPELKRFHKTNLEIYRAIQEKERAIDRFRQHYGKGRWFISRKRKKLVSLYPRLFWLWIVNLLTNAYMEWWQRRRKALIFPGHFRLRRREKG